MIGIIDYGMGNLFSVYHALEMVGADVKICNSPVDLDDVERVVLPGVGAFRDCISNLEKRGFIDALEKNILGKSKPFLGICLGMQLLARKSEEGGIQKGLGWFDADVLRLAPGEAALRVPQIGWNDIRYRKESPFFAGLPQYPDFYFVHSYAMKCNNENDIEAVCDYGSTVTAAVRKNNIFAVQFHPEKSQEYGLKILSNFVRWNP